MYMYVCIDPCMCVLFAGKAQLEYTCLAFTSDGKKLATLSGVPDFLLTIWWAISNMADSNSHSCVGCEIKSYSGMESRLAISLYFLL